MAVPTLRSLASEFLERVGLKKWLTPPPPVPPPTRVAPPPPSPQPPVVVEAAPAPAPVKRKPTKRPKKKASLTPVHDQLILAFESHPKKEALRSLGQQKDQLLRSLVPLYLAQKLEGDITSGVISRFWEQQGVKFAPPNAAKALRKHAGLSRVTGAGRQITQAGIEHLETAMQQKH